MIEETNLGKRRVQLIRGSHFVNLPKFWANYCKLRKGDRLQIDLLSDGSLRISVIEGSASLAEAGGSLE